MAEDNAWTIPISALTDATQNFNSVGTGWQTIQDATITSTGNSVWVHFYSDLHFENGGFGGVTVEYRILRDSTTIHAASQIGVTDSNGDFDILFGMSFVDSPSAGTYTYKFQCRFASSWGTPNIAADHTTALLLETKK